MPLNSSMVRHSGRVLSLLTSDLSVTYQTTRAPSLGERKRKRERKRKKQRRQFVGTLRGSPPIMIKGDGSTENRTVQEDCMRSAALEGLVGTFCSGTTICPAPHLHPRPLTHASVALVLSAGGLQALAVSTVGVLGACRIWPKFERSLSVSSKTALIATPFFGTFVLLSELRRAD